MTLLVAAVPVAPVPSALVEPVPLLEVVCAAANEVADML